MVGHVIRVLANAFRSHELFSPRGNFSKVAESNESSSRWSTAHLFSVPNSAHADHGTSRVATSGG